LAQDKLSYVLTHKSALSEVIRTLETAEAVKSALHDDASKAERDDVNSIIVALGKAKKALEKHICPNGMFSIITINKRGIKKIAQTID